MCRETVGYILLQWMWRCVPTRTSVAPDWNCGNRGNQVG